MTEKQVEAPKYVRNPLGYQDFRTYLQTNFNLLKLSINGFEEIFEHLYQDVEVLKGIPLKPDRAIALALLEYISWKNHRFKKTIDVLCKETLAKYLNWVDDYCKKHNTNREKVLGQIIGGEL